MRNQLGYGNFLQDGGEPMQDPNGEQMMQQAEGQPQGGGGGQDPQAIAQQFLEAFAQLPPEAQQMIHQAIMQQMQQG